MKKKRGQVLLSGYNRNDRSLLILEQLGACLDLKY